MSKNTQIYRFYTDFAHWLITPNVKPKFDSQEPHMRVHIIHCKGGIFKEVKKALRPVYS